MKHDINNTPLVPYIISERALWNVIEKDKRYKDAQPHDIAAIVAKHSPKLVEKAEHIYSVNASFRKQLNDKRRDCRYVLEMFMEHWSLALLKL